MATPTISGISPAIGPSAGKSLAVITGTNFKIPVTTLTVPMVASTPTVSVTIGGRACGAVRVISATEIHILTPRYRGSWNTSGVPQATFAASDVVVTNLDANGAAIVGETVTEAAGFTYYRWVLGQPRSDPVLLRVLMVLIGDLARDVCEHVAIGTHTDFGEGSSVEIIPLMNLPYIGLKVDTPRDREYGEEDNGFDYVERPAGGWDEYESGTSYMLIATLTLAGGTKREAFHLCQAVGDFVRANPLLEVPADPVVYAGLTDEYPIEVSTEPRMIRSTVDNNSNITMYSMQLQVRGIRVMPDDTVQRIYEIDDFTLSETTMDAEQFTQFTID